MTVRPRIADVQCSRLQFQPGDRVLVKSTHRLGVDVQKKLRRSIQRWAGCEIRIFFVNVMDFDLEIVPTRRSSSGLCLPD